jgi:GR25 family glycosyltransferase involved in LPS biosynthesis
MMPPGFLYERGKSSVLPVAEVVKKKPADWSSAGTDGYFISKRGARKLLDLLHLDGLAGDIDWRLMLYSLDATERRALLEKPGFMRDSLEFHQHFVRSREKLESYVLLPALVKQFSAGSVRLWDNHLPHANLELLSTRLQNNRKHLADRAQT